MYILIIEENEVKFNHIKDSLNRVLDSPWIGWQRSKTTGLVALMHNNVENRYNHPYDLVICDTHLPDYEYDKEEEKYVKEKKYSDNIVDEIRALGLEELPIFVISSNEVEESDWNYKIKYDPSTRLDYILEQALVDLFAYQCIKAREENKFDYTGVKGKALLEYRTELKDSCSAYDPLGLCNILECLYCDNAAFKLILNNESITNNDTNLDLAISNDPHEILFYDYVPTIDNLYSYLFDEGSKYKVVRKLDNEVMVDTTKKKEKTLIRK